MQRFQLASDEIVHALALDDRVRVVVATTTMLAREASRLHGATPLSSIAIGRLLTATALLGATTKGVERLSLQVEGGGPLGILLARALPDGSVYGTVGHPDGVPKPDAAGDYHIGDAVGRSGRLTVIRDIGMGAPYVGVVELQSGEIGEDVAHYLQTSEQIRSALGVGVLLDCDAQVEGAGGFLVQVLGGLQENELASIEARIEMTQRISELVAIGDDVEAILQSLGFADARILERRPLRYHAPTDRGYYRARLASLDTAALDSIFAEDDEIELTCEFTRETHRFARRDLRQLGQA